MLTIYVHLREHTGLRIGGNSCSPILCIFTGNKHPLSSNGLTLKQASTIRITIYYVSLILHIKINHEKLFS